MSIVVTSFFYKIVGDFMDLEILDFEVHLSKTKLGCILIQYEDLILRCELVYHVGEQKAWIRMPEMWFCTDFKKKFAYWPTKEKSDEFQKIALEKLYAKYDLDLNKVAQLQNDNIAMRKVF
jgi:hypothetical protein